GLDSHDFGPGDPAFPVLSPRAVGFRIHSVMIEGPIHQPGRRPAGRSAPGPCRPTPGPTSSGRDRGYRSPGSPPSPPSVRVVTAPTSANRPRPRAGHRGIPPVPSRFARAGGLPAHRADDPFWSGPDIPSMVRSPGHKLKLGERDVQEGSRSARNLRKLE